MYNRHPLRNAILTIVVVVGGLAGAAWALGGQPATEKVLTAMAMPLGVAWLLLIGLVAGLATVREAGFGWTAALVLALLSLAGNGDFAAYQIEQLEDALDAGLWFTEQERAKADQESKASGDA